MTLVGSRANASEYAGYLEQERVAAAGYSY